MAVQNLITQEQETAIIQQGDQLLSEGKLEEATAAYTQAILLNSNSSAAYTKLGEVFARQEQYNNAITCFRRAIQIEPEFDWLHYNLGVALIHLNQLQQATKSLQYAVRLNPDFAWSQYYLGYCYLSTKQLDSAIARFQDAIKLNPDLAWAYFYLGEALAKQEQFEEAVAAYSKALELQPGQEEHTATDAASEHQQETQPKPGGVPLYQGLVTVLLKLQRWQEAEQQLQQMLRLHPQSHWAHSHLGEVFIQQQQWELALDAYQQAITLEPEDQHYQSRYQEAFTHVEALKQTTPLQPSHNQTENPIDDSAVELPSLESSDAALSPLEFILSEAAIAEESEDTAALADLEFDLSDLVLIESEPEPSGIDLYYEIADHLTELGFVELAQATAQDLAALLPGQAPPLSILKQYFQAANDLMGAENRSADTLAAAEAAYIRILKISPDSAPAYCRLAEVYTAQGNYESALEYYWQSIDLDPDFLWGYYGLGVVLVEQQRYLAALEVLQYCLGSEEIFEPACRKIGECAQRSGDAIATATIYNQLLQTDALTESSYLEIVKFASLLIRQGLATIVCDKLLVDLDPQPPRLCEDQQDRFLQPELLLLQVMAQLQTNRLTPEQVFQLDAYYRRVDRSACRQSIYQDTIQPLLIWGHNLIFCRDTGTVPVDDLVDLQHLVLVLSRIALDRYDDPRLALSFLQCSSSQTGSTLLLNLVTRVNARLGKHYEVVTAAAKCLSSTEDATIYMLAASSALEVAQSSLPLITRSIEQILDWLITSYRMHPAKSRSRQLLDVALTRFAHRVISGTHEIGQQSSVRMALNLRQTALEQLSRLTERTSRLMQDASRTAPASAVPPVRPRFGRAMIVGTYHIPQCYYYRVQQKLSHFDLSDFVAEFVDGSELVGLQWQKRLLETDVVILCRLPATFEVLRMIHYTRSLGIPVLYDIDDLIFDADHFPAPLESYAGTIDHATHIHLTLDNPFFQVVLPCCDGIIVSTQPLADQVRRFVSPETPVWIYPNLMGDDLAVLSSIAAFAPSFEDEEDENIGESTAKKPLRLFYGSGTKAHKQPFYEVVVPALVRILANYDHVELHLIGHFELPAVLEPFAERIVVNSFIADYSAYLMEQQQADISLSILEDTVATDCKSEIKWLEAAAFGIPSVLTPTGTYRHLLQDESEALFATTADEWFNALTRLIESPRLRTQIGAAAHQRAWKDYSAATGQRCIEQIVDRHLPPVPQRRKRLLVVNVFFAPQSIGGATRVVETQVRYLLEHYASEYEIYILCADHDASIRAPYEVEQYAFGEALVTKLYVPGRDWADHQDGQVQAFCQQFYSAYKFDLIHFHCVQVLTAAVVDAAQSLKIPYVVTAHDGWWLSRHQFLVDPQGNLIDPQTPWLGATPSRQLTAEQNQHMLANWRADMDRRSHLMRCLKQAQAVLAVSPSFAEIYRSVGLNNVVVNENGIEPFERLPRQPSFTGRVRVAHIGGVSRHKGFHLFREALEQGNFNHIEAIVIDHSLEPGEVQHETWGTTPVTLKPKVKQSEIAELYSQIDVLVAPSIWPESYGLVTREALYAGVWVIASNRGAIGADVVEGVNGNVVDVEDSTELVKALKTIDQSPQFYAQSLGVTESSTMRSAGEQLIELVEIYRQIME